jgi:hypothetical protein
MNQSAQSNRSDQSNTTRILPVPANNNSIDPVLLTQIILMVFIISLNSIVVFLFISMKKHRKLIKFSDYLFLSLTLSDLCVGTISLSAEMLFTTRPGIWTFGQFMCLSIQIVAYSQYICSFLSLFLLSAHRFMQIKMPLVANERMTIVKSLLIATTWLLPYGFFTTIFLIHSSQGRVNFRYCFARLERNVFICVTVIFNAFPIFSMIFLNTLTFISIIQNKQRRNRMMSRTKSSQVQDLASSQKYNLNNSNTSENKARKIINKKQNNNQQIETSRRNSLPKKRVTYSLDTQNENAIKLDSMKVTSSKASSKVSPSDFSTKLRIKRISKDMRASICISMVIANLIVTQLFNLTVWPINYFCPACVSSQVLQISYWMNYTFSAFNPIILMIFHERYKREFKKFFCCCDDESDY